MQGLRGKNYKVRLNGDEVLLLDRKELKPLSMTLFEIVENTIDRGIVKKGYPRETVGSPNLDENTIMGNLAYQYYGCNNGDKMDDASCYIFAILNATGCIRNKYGYVEKIY